MKKLALLSCCLIWLCVLFLNSCKKSEGQIEVSKPQLTEEQILFKWGQAHNGRWMPYLLSKVKKEHPVAKGEEIFMLLGSYLEPVNNAVAYFSDESQIGTSTNVEGHLKKLQEYYVENYEKINNSLELRKDMDRLYEEYKRMSLEKISSARKMPFGKIQATRDVKKRMDLGGDLKDVQIVGQCYVPRGLYSWIEQYYGVLYLQLIRSGASPSWVPEYPTISKTHKGDFCEAKYKRFQDAVWNLVNSFGGPCTDQAAIAMDAIEDYHDCIPENGSSPTDPYGPGGSGGSGSGSVNTEDPGEKYELIVASDSIILEDEFECFENVPTNANTVYGIKICADVPVNSNPNALVNTALEPGHTFIELTKTNGSTTVTKTIGFYPEKYKKAALQQTVKGMVVDNEAHAYDASFSMTVDHSQFETILSTAKIKGKKNYDMTDYNCTTFALDVFNSFGMWVVVADWTGAGTGKNYRKTPNGLYNAIKFKVQYSVPGASLGSGTGKLSTDCN
ncbi:hypothetical protein [Pedobacter frigoris]|uniref:hypothetical protein n=1 Tax=Pedobacter frigoris TaxID=2571272 RepID=UPI002930DAE3|nr:hypothetical protein [Pedobacter frigoris]